MIEIEEEFDLNFISGPYRNFLIIKKHSLSLSKFKWTKSFVEKLLIQNKINLLNEEIKEQLGGWL